MTLKTCNLFKNEMKQWEMAKSVKMTRVRFFIGDVRDKERLNRVSTVLIM